MAQGPPQDVHGGAAMTSRPARIYPASNLEQTRGEDWRDSAECRDVELIPGDDPFFPERGQDYVRAAIICRSCPVIDACLKDALARERMSDRIDGYRGGMTPDERRLVIKASRTPAERKILGRRAANFRKARERAKEAADADR